MPVSFVFDGERHRGARPGQRAAARRRAGRARAWPTAREADGRGAAGAARLGAQRRQGQPLEHRRRSRAAPEWLPLLWDALTPKRVRALLAHLVQGEVERFYLPGIAAINFVLHDALDGGGPASPALDPLGKGMAQMLLDMPIGVPRSLAAGL